MEIDKDYIMFVLSLIVALLGWFATKVYFGLEEKISDLYKKHESDSRELKDLTIKVAENYNNKDEIKDMFEDMKVAMFEGFKQIKELIEKK